MLRVQTWLLQKSREVRGGGERERERVECCAKELDGKEIPITMHLLQLRCLCKILFRRIASHRAATHSQTSLSDVVWLTFHPTFHHHIL